LAVLSTPDRSCLLLLDFRKDHTDALPEDIRDNLERRLLGLDKATRLLRVPCFLGYPTGVSDIDVGLRAGEHTFKWADGASPWSDGPPAKAIADENRTRLFLGGFWLEDSVTFAALGALADGHDVYVMFDVALARRAETREAAIERMVQAGVVPITAVQVVSEWAAMIEDADIRTILREIISKDLS